MKKMLVVPAVVCLLVTASFGSAKEAVIDRIVAIVNNDIITLSELNDATRPYKERIAASDKSQADKKEMIRSLERDILDKMVDRTLTRQEAAKHNIIVSDADIQSAIENFKKQNNLDQKGLEKGLEAQGITYAEYQDRIREDIMQSMLINRAVRSKVIITQADIETYYENHTDAFKGEKKYKLRNILLDTKQGIQDVVSRLEQGVSFQEAARQYSMASNADEGGDLGVFDMDNFNETIRDAVLPLKEKQYSDIIQAGQGYQIIYVEDILETGGKTLDQAKEEIQDILYREQVEQKFTDWIASLKENAHVKIML
ncbi:MAG: SurA N-terminal domain-containing protein [Desulfotignum sp.]|jgi:peptidyl-prolyl cis-trans isomerase SurA|nr:SurA N-terminal domain-containing protein [Desulfotignum sp.]